MKRNEPRNMQLVNGRTGIQILTEYASVVGACNHHMILSFNKYLLISMCFVPVCTLGLIIHLPVMPLSHRSLQRQNDTVPVLGGNFHIIV